MESAGDNAMAILNVSVYAWQRKALETMQSDLQRQFGEFSLAQTVRYALSQILPRPDLQPQEQAA